MPSLLNDIIHNGVRIKVEAGCASCAFETFDKDKDPCITCHSTFVSDNSYPLWVLDPSYASDDEGEASPASSGVLPRQQIIGHIPIAEVVDTLKGYSQRCDTKNWSMFIIKFIFELQKLQEAESIPAPPPGESEKELGVWLAKLHEYSRQLSFQRELQLEQQKAASGTAQPAVKPLNEAVEPSVELGAAAEPSFDVGVARSRLAEIEKCATLISRRYEPTPEEREAHQAAYMKPAIDRKNDYVQAVIALNKDIKAWQEKGNSTSWTYVPPLSEDAGFFEKIGRAAVDVLRSAEEETWQSHGHWLNSRRAVIIEERANAQRFTAQRKEDYRSRGLQELFIVTRNKVEADPRHKALMTEKAAINAAIYDHKRQQERGQDMNRGRSR